MCYYSTAGFDFQISPFEGWTGPRSQFSGPKANFLKPAKHERVSNIKYQNILTEHEVVNSSLLWNKIRPCSSTEIISPTLRLLKFRKTYCFRWQPWITRVHDKEFNTLVIYPVPSFQIDAVGNWNGKSLTGMLQNIWLWRYSDYRTGCRNVSHCQQQ